MTQHDSNLSLNQRGKDVALLQNQLISTGYTIASSELLSELCGKSIQLAVRHFCLGSTYCAKGTYHFAGGWQKNQPLQRKKREDLVDLDCRPNSHYIG